MTVAVKSIVAVATGIAMLMSTAASAQTAGRSTAEREKQGYWWYDAPPKVDDGKDDPDALVKPAIPPMA